MLHSILIAGGRSTQRLTKAQSLASNPLTPNPDLVILTADPSVTIKQVRTLETFLSKKPYQSPLKTALIPQAENLTLPAQHALLKTLEEPPARSLIILLSTSAHRLLPTIISRCQVFDLTSQPRLNKTSLAGQQRLYQTITQANFGQRLVLAAEHAKTKLSALRFCRRQLIFLRSVLITKPSLPSAKLTRQIIRTIIKLNANVNPRLAIENLFFSYPKP